MQNETVFRLITFLLLAAAFGTSGYYRRKADREGGQLQTDGRGLLIILRLLALLVLLPLLGYLINPAWVAWARLSLSPGVRWLGVVAAAGMMPLFVWLFRSIGQNISPTQATREDHQLVTCGPYRWIRHPLYTFGFLFYLALALVTGLWWLVVSLLPVWALLLWRTKQEEANLVAEFGDEYRQYMARTGRFFPRLGT